MALLFSVAVATVALGSPNKLGRTPPMGWMSWQGFRCETNCAEYPDECINEKLYRDQADALVAGGFVEAGYSTIHLDDCIVDKTGRDPTTNELRADPERFPSGFKASVGAPRGLLHDGRSTWGLGDYLHARNISFGFYSAESTGTCGGYPASKGYEEIDAKSFASWGVDYLKADGCGAPSYYKTGYPAMGAALQASGRDIVYSCSWPAYLGNDETTKPFASFIDAGCNLWRNFIDMGPTTGYMKGILEHFGNYSSWLQTWAGPGHFHDADMLLVGIDGVPDAAQGTQLALYSILAVPLIMGNDLRVLSDNAKKLLLNKDVVAVSQDPAGRAGIRLGGESAANAPTQTWIRSMQNGDVAVGLYNQGPPQQHPWHSKCDAFNVTQGGYHAPAGDQPASWCGPALGETLMEWYCCNTDDCAGYNFSATTKSGCMFKNLDGGFVKGDANTTGHVKASFQKPHGEAADMTVVFAEVGLFDGSTIQVYDVWAQKVVATTNASSYTAAAVPWQGTAFLRLSTVPTVPADIGTADEGAEGQAVQ